MKKNNKGFTMIEIIGAVIIMGVLLLLIIPGVSKLMQRFRNDYYEKLELTINESGKDFYSDNKVYLPDGILEATYVNVSSLISSKYAESLLDYRGKTCKLEDKKSYTIVVYRGNGKYDYQTCIDCSDDGYVTNKKGTYCDPAWLDNNLGYDYGGTNDIYFYYGTSREKIREDLIKRLNIVKYDQNGNVIDRVVVGDTEEEGILPTNIDIIDNKPTLDADNKREYTMIYGSDTDNNKEELLAIIYKHKSPKVTMTTGGNIYTSGNWTNKNVVIKLEKNDNFFELAGRKVGKYQWSIDGNAWEDIDCDMVASDESCTVSIMDDDHNSTYKFRLINDEGNISDETIEYRIKIDKILPSLTIDVIEDTIIKELTTSSSGQTVSNIIQDAEIKISVQDGPSGIDYTRVCENSSCSNRTELSFSVYPNSGTVTVTTYDKAGNSKSNSVTIYYDEIDNTTDIEEGGDEGGGDVILPSGGCSLTLDPNGGSVSQSYITATCGDEIQIPKPTKSGSIFLGWYTSCSGGTSVGDSQGYYELWGEDYACAHWVEGSDACTVRFVSEEGGYVSPTEAVVSCGTSIGLSYAHLGGHVFTGWYNSSGNYVGTIGSNYTVNSNITLYAHWDEDPSAVSMCRITYDANGGTATKSSEDVECGSSVTLPSATRGSYGFNGWYTSSSGGSRIGGAGTSYKVDDDITVYAQWNSNTYTVYYNANGDTGTVNSTTCTVGVPCTLRENTFTMANYHNIKGWKTSSGTKYSGGASVTNLASAGSSITLYSYYECDRSARSYNQWEVEKSSGKWPWSLSNPGCNVVNSSNTTCIPEGATVWRAYYVRCIYCGTSSNNNVWCPVHNSNGGANIAVCDASSKRYSTNTCKRGVSEGWTKI